MNPFVLNKSLEIIKFLIKHERVTGKLKQLLNSQQVLKNFTDSICGLEESWKMLRRFTVSYEALSLKQVHAGGLKSFNHFLKSIHQICRSHTISWKRIFNKLRNSYT